MKRLTRAENAELWNALASHESLLYDKQDDLRQRINESDADPYYMAEFAETETALRHIRSIRMNWVH